MFGNSVELRNEIRELKREIRDIKCSKKRQEGLIADLRLVIKEKDFDIKKLKKMQYLEVQEARLIIQKEVHRLVTETDLRRVKAESALATYKDTMADSKASAAVISDTLKSAVSGLGNKANIEIHNDRS